MPKLPRWIRPLKNWKEPQLNHAVQGLRQSWLPRIEVLHDIDTKTCSCCGHELHWMGEEVSEQVEFIPAQIQLPDVLA